MKVRVSSIVVAAGAALVLGGCGGTADGSQADTAAAPDTPAATSTSTSVAAPTTGEPTSTPETTAEPTGVETTGVESPAAAPTTLVDVDYAHNESYFFTSPDGRFQCGIVQLPTRTEAGCEGVTDPVPPQPNDCMVNWGHGMRVVDAGEGEFLCSGGPVYLPAEGTGPVLPAGSTLSQLGYTCTTTDTDVTCTRDGSGHGFTIAADSNETF